MDDGTPKRAYDNRLREQQAQATRERILDAMAEQLAEDKFAGFSLARVAKRAGVSEPTIYRHFGGREGLFEAFAEWFEARGSHPGFPEHLDELLARGIGPVFRYFEEHEPYIRAARTPQIAEVFAPGRRKRQAKLREILAESTADLDSDQAAQIQAVFAYLMSSRAYLALKDEMGLSTDAAASAIDWALRALAEAIPSSPSDPESPAQ